MSKLIKTDAEYSRWIQELKERYRRSQIKAAAQVNCEMLRFYWSLGRDIVARDAENVYGSGFYRNLSQDLKAAIPEAEGFSRQNLQYMKKMYLLYSELPTNCPQLVGNSQNVNSQQVVGKSADTTDNVIFSILHLGIFAYLLFLKTYHMDREELKKLYNTPANLRLKHIALCVIGMSIAILISMIFLVDKASWQLLAVMRGCAGVLAIIFVIIVAVLVYRVNNAYITKGRRNKK